MFSFTRIVRKAGPGWQSKPASELRNTKVLNSNSWLLDVADVSEVLKVVPRFSKSELVTRYEMSRPNVKSPDERAPCTVSRSRFTFDPELIKRALTNCPMPPIRISDDEMVRTQLDADTIVGLSSVWEMNTCSIVSFVTREGSEHSTM